jgi:hypothetical protein
MGDRSGSFEWRPKLGLKGGAIGKENRDFLDEPAGLCYCFPEVAGKPGSRASWAPGWRLVNGRRLQARAAKAERLKVAQGR